MSGTICLFKPFLLNGQQSFAFLFFNKSSSSSAPWISGDRGWLGAGHWKAEAFFSVFGRGGAFPNMISEACRDWRSLAVWRFCGHAGGRDAGLSAAHIPGGGGAVGWDPSSWRLSLDEAGESVTLMSQPDSGNSSCLCYRHTGRCMCVLLEGVLEVAVNRNERGFFPLNSLKGKLRPRKTVRGDGKGERGWGLRLSPSPCLCTVLLPAGCGLRALS